MNYTLRSALYLLKTKIFATKIFATKIFATKIFVDQNFRRQNFHRWYFSGLNCTEFLSNQWTAYTFLYKPYQTVALKSLEIHLDAPWEDQGKYPSPVAGSYVTKIIKLIE